MPSLHTMVTQPSRTGRGTNPSVWRGVVVNLTATAVWVRAPTLADDDLTATNTIPGDLHPGDRVIIAAVEGRVDNLVVIAKENPSVPAHTHPENQITYPGWADADVLPPWSPAASSTRYEGLRYRTDSRFLYLNGNVTGGPGTIADIPVTLAYSATILTATSTGTPLPVDVFQNGLISCDTAGTLRVNGYAPLT